MNQFEDHRQGPTDAPAPGTRPGGPGPGPGTGPAQQAYMVGMPMAYPMDPQGGRIVMVNGMPQQLGRGSSRVMVGAIVFATCVLPLLIIAAVWLMMPDFDSIFSPDSGAPSSGIPSITIQPR